MKYKRGKRENGKISTPSLRRDLEGYFTPDDIARPKKTKPYNLLDCRAKAIAFFGMPEAGILMSSNSIA
jgi:hypothetical protein